MKRTAAIIALLGTLSATQASVIQFDLSPPGTDSAVGLSPLNEVPPATNSTASGNEISGGINFDTDTLTLNLAIGFGNLSAPITVLHIHGPTGPGTNAPVIVNLAPYLFTQGNPAFGGVIFGAVPITTNQVADLLAGLNYINIHTTNYPGGEIRGQLTPHLEMNTAPIVTCPPPATVECGASTALSTQVSDLDGDALTVVWSVNGSSVKTETFEAGTTMTPVESSVVAEFPLGTNDINVTVTDSETNSASCDTTLTVVDTTPPVIVMASATPNTLWPPNHKMVDVTVKPIVTDACSDTQWEITGVSSSESVNGTGDGNTSPDWQITGPHTLKLRAERSGVTGPRTYTITVEAKDASGNVSQPATLTVTVPHDKGNNKKGKSKN